MHAEVHLHILTDKAETWTVILEAKKGVLSAKTFWCRVTGINQVGAL